MRVLLSTLVLLGAAFAGYFLFPAASAQQATFVPAGVTAGERVRVFYDLDRGLSQDCTVIAVRGDFLGCKVDRPMSSEGQSRWYNLRLVVRIDRPAQE